MIELMNKRQSNSHQLFLVALFSLVQHSIKELEILCSIRFALAFLDRYGANLSIYLLM